MMFEQNRFIEALTTLNQIAYSLNHTADVRGALDRTLAQLVKLMNLETGWIFLRDDSAQERWAGRGYVLAAHHNLPPAMLLENSDVWTGGCDCQALCNRGKLTEAYNEVRCSRLAAAGGDRRNLAVHASAPLCSGDRVLGILNVAGPSWDAFTPEALAMLANAGSQIGIALDRARLYELVREQRLEEQAALLTLSNRLLRRPDLDEMICCLVEEVRRLLQVDACALLLPDAGDPDYLVFRSAVGWHSDPVAEGRRVPVGAAPGEGSGSGWVMAKQRPLVMDPDKPMPILSEELDWLHEEDFKAAAIVPLLVDGRSIGTLVIDDREPRHFGQDDLRFLQLMANQAAIAIERARTHEEEIRRQRLEEEMAVGRQIQLSLLPKSNPIVAGWEFASIYQAANQVGGDFYDFFELPDAEGQCQGLESGGLRRLGLVIADVADKGVPAALFMAMSRTMIRMTGVSGRTPGAALSRANQLILNDSQADLFLSAFYGVLDAATGRLVYANAGHNSPLWYRAAHSAYEKLVPTGMVLGVLDEISLQEREITVAAGDFLVFYTDGVTEAMTADYQEFGEERLRQAALARAGDSADAILWSIVEAVNAFTTATPQSDDFTLFVVKRHE
jgi:serine phosphatase RsbU (regulator of sigma subunit)